ncbi:hypothetical protein NUW54_g9491 [Trametes sanguinea]|uniref:Uncharacterized protein n=1 Tax=Trametes sanguinea TaxID=158606 RepID=A0ACC1P617_9APHY|nr:hypothetical protein NUW54_g9491 [Trametes sanguinea]
MVNNLSVSIPSSPGSPSTPPSLTMSSPTSPQRSNTMVIAHLPESFFEPEIQDALRSHFQSYGPLHTWAPIRGLKRVFIVFYSAEDAETAKESNDGLILGDTLDDAARLSHGHPTPIETSETMEHNHYLRPPVNEKNFLISPPGSPPVGWEQIREDISANMGALETLQAKFGCQILFVESGGDNLAANYSRELADYIIYVIDVSGGDKIPRKGGPGISQSDLLVINKVDLAPYVGASLEVMERDSKLMRGDGPTVFTSVKQGKGVDDVADLILAAWRTAGSPGTPGAVPEELLIRAAATLEREKLLYPESEHRACRRAQIVPPPPRGACRARDRVAASIDRRVSLSVLPAHASAFVPLLIRPSPFSPLGYIYWHTQLHLDNLLSSHSIRIVAALGLVRKRDSEIISIRLKTEAAYYIADFLRSPTWLLSSRELHTQERLLSPPSAQTTALTVAPLHRLALHPIHLRPHVKAR